MKKVIIAVVFLAAVAAGAFFVLKKVVAHTPRAAELVPADTVLFAQIPDTLTSAQRFSKTALWDILQEPELQRAFSDAESNPLFDDWRKFALMLPREGFVAITSIEGAVPKFVAGFAYSGRQKDAEAVAAGWRSALRQRWPAGKGDFTTYGTREIETFTDKDFAVAEVFCDGWYFIADDLELLHRTIDRLDGKTPETSLAASALYKQAIAPLPGAPDALLVAQTGVMIERVASLAIAAGQKTDPKEFDELRKMKAISATMKFDGKNCRDSIFVLRPGSAPEPPLARNALALSSSTALLYYAMRLPETLEISEENAPMLALLPGWDALNQALMEKHLALADLPKAFGPEFGALVDWSPDEESASGLLALDVRDAEKAAIFVSLLTSGVGEIPWEKSERDGVTFFTTPMMEFSPTVALTGNFALIGLTRDAVAKGLGQMNAGQGRIDTTATYGAATGAVARPTSGFGYIDLKTLFERGYAPLKSLLGVSLAFTSEAGQMLDAGKLPSAEIISRHLGPIVYSQATTEQGTFIESTGPVTFNQVLLGVMAGAIGTALPSMEAALADGSLDPGQLMKNLAAPGSEPAPAETDPVELGVEKE